MVSRIYISVLLSILVHLFIYSAPPTMCVCMCAQSQLSPSTMWIPRTELRSSGLAQAPLYTEQSCQSDFSLLWVSHTNILFLAPCKCLGSVQPWAYTELHVIISSFSFRNPTEANCTYFKFFTTGENARIFQRTTKKGEDISYCDKGGVREAWQLWRSEWQRGLGMGSDLVLSQIWRVMVGGKWGQ